MQYRSVIFMIIFLISFYVDAYARTTILLSKNSQGEQLNGDSRGPEIAANGNKIVFESNATNFNNVIGDNNNIYVVNRLPGGNQTTLISSTQDGFGGDRGSSGPKISADGSCVAFSSLATNLSLQGSYYVIDAFLKDITSGNYTLQNINEWGNYSNADAIYTVVSNDCRYVAFVARGYLTSNSPYLTSEVYVRDNIANTTALVSSNQNGIAANAATYYPSISGNGRIVAFESTATNLVPGVTDGLMHIYAKDLITGSIELVDQNNLGQPANGNSGGYGLPVSISEDGRYIVFMCNGGTTNLGTILGGVLLRDRILGTTTPIFDVNEFGQPITGIGPYISDNGRFITFRSDGKGIAIFDREFGAWDYLNTTDSGELPVAVYSHGTYPHHFGQDPKISEDGRYVAFYSSATNLVSDDTNLKSDVFLVDRANDNDGDGSLQLNDIIHDDCNDNVSAINPGATEIPYNGVDENCNGMADDDDLDHDGYGIANDCNDNEANIHPGATEIPYNGIDENCNGMADDTDYDGDGYDFAVDCNDNDATINPGATEIPYNGIDENCNGMADDDDLDHDGFGIANDCNDNDASINPGTAEIPYNGIDENCNGMADDDDLDHDGHGIAEDCNDTDPTIYIGATEIKHDGIDQNCNGYDLTIDATTTYKANKDRLTVDATSSLESAANLVLDGYGPMTYSGNKWSIIVEPAGGNPGTVTITGIEGSETATVQ